MQQTKIKFDLSGLENLAKQMGSTYRARVGILGSHAQRQQGDTTLNNAELGAIQMFGSVTKNIPPRDFLRFPIELNKREIVRAMESKPVKAAVAAGDYKQVYALLGAKALEFVLEAFATSGFGQWAPNAPATIAKKGSDRPLIDWGELRRAQTSDVVKKSDIA